MDASRNEEREKNWRSILKNAFELNNSRDTSPPNNAASNEILLPFKIISPRSRRDEPALIVYTSLTDDKSNILNAIPLQTRRKSKNNQKIYINSVS